MREYQEVRCIECVDINPRTKDAHAGTFYKDCYYWIIEELEDGSCYMMDDRNFIRGIPPDIMKRCFEKCETVVTLEDIEEDVYIIW